MTSKTFKIHKPGRHHTANDSRIGLWRSPGRTGTPETGTPVNEHTAEMVAYAVAFTVLVVAGMILRTLILNVFVGPLIVVASVAVITPLLSRRRP